MDDWFNEREKSGKNRSERKVGRIIQEDNYDSSFDLPQTENYPKEDYFERNYGQKTETNFDFDSILNSEKDRYITEPLNFEKTETNINVMTTPKIENNSFEDVSSSKVRKIKKSKPKGKKIALSIIAIILVVTIGLVGYGYSILGSLNYMPETHVENAYISASELNTSSDVENILILGTDKRKSQSNYRSDTMMLLSIDKKHKALKLTSFLRDSWVYIPAKDRYAKLNAACAYGGPQMVIDTIEYNFKVKIDSYVMIDFNIFRTIINDIGGITLDISEAEAACITREAGYECKPGTRHVKGKTALWYARIRHLDSDFNRTARQRKVISAIVDQVKTCSIPTLVNTVKDVLPEIQTDINKNKLMTLGLSALLSYMNYDIVEQQIPAKGTWWNAYVNREAVLKYNSEENEKVLKEFIYDKTVEEINEDK